MQKNVSEPFFLCILIMHSMKTIGSTDWTLSGIRNGNEMEPMQFWTAFNSVILIHDLVVLLIADWRRHCRRHHSVFWFFFIVAENRKWAKTPCGKSVKFFFSSVRVSIGFVSNHDQYACHSFKQFETWEWMACKRGTMQESRVKRRRGRRKNETVRGWAKSFNGLKTIYALKMKFDFWSWFCPYYAHRISYTVQRTSCSLLVARIQTQLSKIQSTRTNECFLFFFE